jgi:protein-S-isoprenylcysteine O-methyltransferase Ste14
MAESMNETAGVIAPPPLIAAGVVAFGLLLDWIAPAYVLMLLLSMETRILLGFLLIVPGAALIVLANLNFRALDTPPQPSRPTVALVTGGIFQRLRNPMYAGGLLVLAGLSILLASDWMMVLTILSAPLLHYGVILREERYLAGKFGDAYRRYQAAVPRYGLPF